MNSRVRVCYRRLETAASTIAARLGVQIWIYHSIADNPRDPHAVHPDLFAAHLAALAARHVSVIELGSALTRLKSSSGMGTVALTFDDAYKDFLENAVPVLRQYHFSATVFAPTGLLGRAAVWDSFDKAKSLMDWDELKEVHRLGFGVGSHTVNHARLTACDTETLDQELKLSFEQLQTQLPDVVPVLAYPGGFYGQREMEYVRRAGYVAALGLASHRPNFPWTNPYRLRRWKAFY